MQYCYLCGQTPNTPSRRRFRDSAYILDGQFIDFFTEAYLGAGVVLPSPDFRICPLSAASHRGLPPHTIIAAELDPLCDEAALYVTKLVEAGVEASLHCFQNTVHGFFCFHYLPEAKAARKLAVSAFTAPDGRAGAE